MNILFPKINNGFMAWNYVNVFDIGIKIKYDVSEKPVTGHGNRFIYF